MNHSAIAIIRLQFEATLKAFWVWVAWKELNSYVHGGVHALANVGREQPASFIVQLLCNSNGVAGLGAMLAASLTGDADRVDAVLAAPRNVPKPCIGRHAGTFRARYHANYRR